MKIKYVGHFLFLFILLSISCKTANFSKNVFDVNGMVYDFSNRPVPYCEIIIGNKYKTSTDINGRFTLPGISIGDYSISGEKRGFEAFFDLISVRERGQIIYFRIPSQSQLLFLLDEALSVNDLSTANEMAYRAYNIDENNIEMLFYYAVVKFKEHDYENAVEFLQKAIDLGSKDVYIMKFLSILEEILNEN